MGYSLGIDLGTTFSSAAVVGPDGRSELVNLSGRTASMPSVVLVRDDGTALFGDAAESRGALDPTRLAREFKRRLGDPTELVLGGVPYSAQTLTSMLLRHVAETVAARQGASAERTTIAHPASYSDYRREILMNAAVEAGLVAPSLVAEPLAAAMHYLARGQATADEVMAIYDFGGGTFDVALVKVANGAPTLLGAPVGVDSLGGIDFDRALVELIDDRCQGALSELGTDDAELAMLARVRRDCREAKELLSSDDEAVVTVVLGDGPRHVRVTRAELARLIKPRLGETFRALRRAAESADISLDHIDRIVLVGGSSRIPIIREQVRVETARPVAEDIDAEHAVALGAALHAAGRHPHAEVAPPPAAPPAGQAPLQPIPPAPPAPLAPPRVAEPSPISPPARPVGPTRRPWVGIGAASLGVVLTLVEIFGVYANREAFASAVGGSSVAALVRPGQEEGGPLPQIDGAVTDVIRFVALAACVWFLVRASRASTRAVTGGWLVAGAIGPLLLAITRYGSFWKEINNGDFGAGAAASLLSVICYGMAWAIGIVRVLSVRQRPGARPMVLVGAASVAMIVARVTPIEDNDLVHLFRIDLSDSTGLAGSNSPGWVALALATFTAAVALVATADATRTVLAGVALAVAWCVVEAERAVPLELTDPVALPLYVAIPVMLMVAARAATRSGPQVASLADQR